MNGRDVTITWNGKEVGAWMPGLLEGAELSLPPEVIRQTEGALSDLSLMEHQIPAAADAIGRMLLRSEGIASSAVEGLRVPIEDVLAVEALGRGGADASWVAGNLAIVSDAIADVDRDINGAVLHRWHRRLMVDSPLAPDLIGRWRPTPGWIGGTSPVDAVYVPPPPGAIGDLMEDLIHYLNGDRDDPITQAAVAHAQFESIHPYGDGNGRIGRVLIGWVLRRRGVVSRWPPPISISIARDPGGYLGGLYEYRAGDPVRWVRWFADVTRKATANANNLYLEIEALQKRWRGSVADLRSDAAAHRVVELLVAHPVISSERVVVELGVSRRAALTALEQLEQRGVLSPFTLSPTSAGRPLRWWIARDLVDLIRRSVA